MATSSGPQFSPSLIDNNHVRAPTPSPSAACAAPKQEVPGGGTPPEGKAAAAEGEDGEDGNDGDAYARAGQVADMSVRES